MLALQNPHTDQPGGPLGEGGIERIEPGSMGAPRLVGAEHYQGVGGLNGILVGRAGGLLSACRPLCTGFECGALTTVSFGVIGIGLQALMAASPLLARP